MIALIIIGLVIIAAMIISFPIYASIFTVPAYIVKEIFSIFRRE